MKIFKYIYYIVFIFIVAVALLLIVSIFPITGNIKFMTVQSGSMEPAIKVGSIVMIKPHSASLGQADYKVGDIISFGAFGKDKSPVTHRIFEIREQNGQPIFVTKGDANNAADQKEVAKKDILGKVLFDAPYLGYVVDFAKKPLGFSLIIIVPAVVIIIDEAKKIYIEIKKKKNETA